MKLRCSDLQMSEQQEIQTHRSTCSSSPPPYGSVTSDLHCQKNTLYPYKYPQYLISAVSNLFLLLSHHTFRYEFACFSSLGVLFHSACSDDVTAATSTAVAEQPPAATVRTEDAVDGGMVTMENPDGSPKLLLATNSTAGTEKPADDLPVTIGGVVGKDSTNTQTAIPTAKATSPAPTTKAPAATEPADKPATTVQTPATVKTITSATQHSVIVTTAAVWVRVSAGDSTVTASHPLTQQTISAALPDDSVRVKVIDVTAAPTQAVTTQKPGTSSALVLVAPTALPDSPDTTGTHKVTEATAEPTTSEHFTTSHSTISSKDSKGGRDRFAISITPFIH